jgi:nucleoside-diphosphate-sugar epimerase
MDNLKQPPSKIFYWPEGKKLWFKSYTNLVGKNAIVRMVSTERLKKELEFEPSYTFDEGIKETIDWYLQNEKNIV